MARIFLLVAVLGAVGCSQPKDLYPLEIYVMAAGLAAVSNSQAAREWAKSNGESQQAFDEGHRISQQTRVEVDALYVQARKVAGKHRDELEALHVEVTNMVVNWPQQHDTRKGWDLAKRLEAFFTKVQVSQL